ncbi:ankyrin repeat domain-containing protein 30A-like [Papio anubis]|uniref:ankyrin repeat domain-containing protein 30A-like n=1 Tax=Papio anubis TaxID=9555 RepID=UPI0012ADC3B4|nr:ankyrin repeat domain-containing protein 30A-like [Papio anubis]
MINLLCFLETPEKPSAFKPASEMQNSVPNEALECKKEQPLRADQMIPSESKQKDKEENYWDLESDRETVSQKDVCLPKATPQKEFHTISEKLEGKNHFLLKSHLTKYFSKLMRKNIL